jgi:hypothetical protein
MHADAANRRAKQIRHPHRPVLKQEKRRLTKNAPTKKNYRALGSVSDSEIWRVLKKCSTFADAIRILNITNNGISYGRLRKIKSQMNVVSSSVSFSHGSTNDGQNDSKVVASAKRKRDEDDMKEEEEAEEEAEEEQELQTRWAWMKSMKDQESGWMTKEQFQTVFSSGGYWEIKWNSASQDIMPSEKDFQIWYGIKNWEKHWNWHHDIIPNP